ncbi:MAG: BolA family protein [Gallionella sp.]|nr:BolA family protein [Gallionella sp.]
MSRPRTPILMKPLAIQPSPQADKSLVISLNAEGGANNRHANSPTMDSMRARLAALEPVALDIRDDSHRHAGHAGARGGGGHYLLHIISPRFTGESTVARHRMVYSSLGEMMLRDIHALNIQALAPDEI